MQRLGVLSKIGLTVLTLNSNLFGLSIDESKQLYPEQWTTAPILSLDIKRV